MGDVSTLFELLASETRRKLLVMLCDTESIDVSNGLPMRCTAATASSPTTQRTASSRDIELYHVHLPKLEAEGVVEWDRTVGSVSRGPEFDAVEPTIRLLAENESTLPGPFY
ncbi:hypothetical protein ACFPYI_11820 [Halomarina salina]|uniref:DUF7344 domain-containing protein n=1 Tax=Halomarina salina TaxID=1872699 RepID=A0ABD5RND5_9EURY|nr:hypothetical protein [Halomarina salina]